MTLEAHSNYHDQYNSGSRTSEDDQTRWYVVQCQPHREAIAAQELVKQGFRSFSPSRLKTRRHARRIETVRAPFFPGYIFISLNLDCDRWRSINGTRGVSRIVAFGEQPCPVPEHVVETFLDRCDDSGVLRDADELKIGQSVRVLTGPFAEIVGTLERLDDHGRVCVLLQIMGGHTPVRLSRNSVGS